LNKRLIYLHGFASGPGSRKARYFHERLSKAGIEVEVPDLAQGDFEGLTISGQLRVVERLARGEPVWLMGSSMGGYLAALYAARHPEVERAVLLAPAFGFARRWSESLGSGKLDEWMRSGYLSVYHFADGGERRVGYGLIDDGLQYEDYPDVRQPVLIFHGTRDAVVPAEYSREFAAARPNVILHLLDSDHELTDVMDAMWRETERFLLTPRP
jgi:hypothetical protein